jgi:hypothetical protein
VGLVYIVRVDMSMHSFMGGASLGPRGSLYFATTSAWPYGRLVLVVWMVGLNSM